MRTILATPVNIELRCPTVRELAGILGRKIERQLRPENGVAFGLVRRIGQEHSPSTAKNRYEKKMRVRVGDGKLFNRLWPCLISLPRDARQCRVGKLHELRHPQSCPPRRNAPSASRFAAPKVFMADRLSSWLAQVSFASNLSSAPIGLPSIASRAALWGTCAPGWTPTPFGDCVKEMTKICDTV